VVQTGLKADGAFCVDAVDGCVRGQSGCVRLLARRAGAADVKDWDDDAEGWHANEMETTRVGPVFKAV